MGSTLSLIHWRGILALSHAMLFVTGLAAQSIDYRRLESEVIRARLEQVEPENAARHETLRCLFNEAGCKGEALEEMPVPGSDLPNVVCTLPGDSGSTIVMGAHYDRGPRGHGIADNWTGAALLPSLFQSARRLKHRHTLVFIGFVSGEKGREGSKHYVENLTKKEASGILAMVNLDCLGLSFTRMWPAGRDKLLSAYLKQVSSSVQLPVEWVEPPKDGQAHAVSFAKRKIPAITVHSITKFNKHTGESDDDTLEAVHEYEYYESYMMLAAYLSFLDTKLE